MEDSPEPVKPFVRYPLWMFRIYGTGNGRFTILCKACNVALGDYGFPEWGRGNGTYESFNALRAAHVLLESHDEKVALWQLGEED